MQHLSRGHSQLSKRLRGCPSPSAISSELTGAGGLGGMTGRGAPVPQGALGTEGTPRPGPASPRKDSGGQRGGCRGRGSPLRQGLAGIFLGGHGTTVWLCPG